LKDSRRSAVGSLNIVRSPDQKGAEHRNICSSANQPKPSHLPGNEVAAPLGKEMIWK